MLSPKDREALNDALTHAEDVIVFGSRAAEVNSKASDVDILCVGESVRRYKSDQLDLVARTPNEIAGAKWLGSELANHVLAYGIVARGASQWRDDIRLAEAAIIHKESRLLALADGLWTYWDRLHPEIRKQYLTTIRRELQRLQLLGDNIAVPPTPLLDRSWEKKIGAGPAEVWLTGIGRIRTGSMATRERLLRTADLILRNRRNTSPIASLDVSFSSATGPITSDSFGIFGGVGN